jgi:hypothetical protein
VTTGVCCFELSMPSALSQPMMIVISEAYCSRWHLCWLVQHAGTLWLCKPAQAGYTNTPRDCRRQPTDRLLCGCPAAAVLLRRGLMFGSDVSENITLDMQVRRDSSSIFEALMAACTGGRMAACTSLHSLSAYVTLLHTQHSAQIRSAHVCALCMYLPSQASSLHCPAMCNS